MAAWSCRLLSVILTYCFIAFVLVCRTTRAFNIDTKSPIIKLGRTDSYFGFSLTHHFVQNHRSGAVTPVLLVGAPRDNVTDPDAPDSVRQLVRPGAVYQCPLTSRRDDCTPVKVDREEPVYDNDRNEQWLGVSVVSQATDDGKAMVCAHRYKLSNAAYRWGLGQCYSLTNSLDEDQVWSPCDGRPRQFGHGEYGFCQAGISAAISQNDEFVLGAPGPVNWRGAVFMNKLVSSLEDDVQWLQSPVEDSTLANPLPDPATGFYSYLGMSVKMATLNGTTWYIGGAPRSKNVGQVLMFQHGAAGSTFLSIDTAHTLTGEQFGAGFGYDIAVADFNLDQKEDLVVGAPFYHAPGVGGAIYVYYNSDQGITSLTEPQTIYSRRMKEQECLQLDCRNARFGFALAAAGDIDRDGFQDLAVGAPYEGSGAVYIFRGSSRGLLPVYSQRISASDFSPVLLRAFGASLSRGNDVDNNGYSDISVGAFSSDAIVLLRARPVVNILKEIVTEPQLIDPQQSVCPIDGSSNKCFLVKLCFRFTAEPRERFTGSMTLRYWLDTERYSTMSKLARAVFVRRDRRPAETTLLEGTLRMNEQTNVNYKCVNHTGYIVKTNRDFLNPILIHLSYNLTDVGDPTLTPGDPMNDINKYPVVNNAASQTNFSIDFVKNCGDDHQCHSSIGVKSFMTSLDPDGESDTSYILRVGESEVTALRIEMMNNGEDAHEASLTITLPPSLEYLGTDSQGEEKYTCSPDDNILHCAIGNPLPAGHGALLSIRLDTQHATSSIEPLNITVQANTTSIELNTDDDRVVLYLQVIVETDLLLRGSSDPNQLVFGGEVVGESAVEYEHNIGPELLLTFEVKNIGNAAVPKATLNVWWPYETSRGQHLLYLLDEPVIYEGSEVRGYCRYDPFWINTLGIKPASSGRGVEASPAPPVRGSSPVSRRRREVESPSTISQLERRSLSSRTSVSLNCEDGSARCRQFVCELGLMLPKASIAFQFRARLWNSTFVENFAEFDGVKIITRSIVTIDPALNIKQSSYLNDIILLETLAIPDISVQGPPGIPLWLIIVSIVAGVLLLILVIIILWRCGFFQRHRSSDIGKHKANFQEYHD